VSCKEEKAVEVENETNLQEPSQNHQVESPAQDQPSTPQYKIPTVQLDRSTFHSVIGWLNDDEILFVLLADGNWTVQAYSTTNDSWRTIYETEVPIIQGEIHPTKEMIMLHVSNHSSSAEIRLINTDGVLQQSLHFESAEMYMSWHPTNPQLIAFSAFYDDWSFNSFVYNGEQQDLVSIEVENPFIKWYDEEHLMVFEWKDSSLDGSKLSLYSIKQKQLKETEWKNILDVIYLGEAYLYIQIDEQSENFLYQLINKNSNETQEWTTPAVSNYSEWVIPNISILYPNKLFITKPTEGGNMDALNQQNVLTSYSVNEEKEFGQVSDLPIDCSPNGKVCLSGYEKEQWIQLEPFKGEEWLEVKE